MMTVLIVEDEILARIGLRQLLPWEKYGFSLLPDAPDGEEALQRIREYEPDLILLDLNIPKVNGLQILEYLKKEKAASKVVIVSCNEEFRMVKEAMKLGAYDYLRKLNLSSEELLGIILRYKKEKENARRESLPEEKSFSFHEIRYEEIISGSGRDIFANADRFQTILCVLFQENGGNALYGNACRIKKWFEEKGIEYIQILKGTQNLYFLFERKLSMALVKELHTELTEKNDGKIYVGMHQGNLKTAEELNEALTLSEQVAVFGYYDEEELIYDLIQKPTLLEYMPKEMHRILSGFRGEIAAFSYEKSVETIHEIFHLITGEKYIRLNVLRRFFMDMLGIYSMTAQSLGTAIEEVELWGSNCHYQNIMSMNSLKEIERWFLEFETLFYDTFYIRFKCSRLPILKEAVSYIEAHLSEPVHLSEAAKEIGVSGAYLSTVFKKEIGQNFIEYANLRKVDLAREMLEQGKMVYEVSDILGFENSTYFSKVFKKYTGVSPDGYRKKN